MPVTAEQLVSEQEKANVAKSKETAKQREIAAQQARKDLLAYGLAEVANKQEELVRSRDSLARDIAANGGVKNPLNATKLAQLKSIVAQLDSIDVTIADLKKPKPEKPTQAGPTTSPFAQITPTAMPQGQQTPVKTTPQTPARQTPTPTPAPTAGESMAGAVTQFNQGRPAVVADQGASGPSVPTKTPTPLETLLKKTEFWYDLPDYIFTAIPKLGEILVQAVNEGWDKKKFLAAAQLTPWWQSNSDKFRQKIIDKAKYDELKAQGVDVSKTDYGQAITGIIRSVKSQAKTIGGITLDDAQAQQIAEKIYNGNLEDDPLAIRQLIVPFIGKFTDKYAGSTVTTYGGEALRNYQILQAIAKANGLGLRDVLPQISAITADGDLEKAVLQGIASGDIDITRVAQNARMVAAQGQPQYVRDLLNQGYDLEQIYSPYKTAMANVLELNPDQIDLNDPTLRGAINNNGDMNIYDFKKNLRKDSRWQYTEGARREVADSALNVLRDFGFQG